MSYLLIAVAGTIAEDEADMVDGGLWVSSTRIHPLFALLIALAVAGNTLNRASLKALYVAVVSARERFMRPVALKIVRFARGLAVWSRRRRPL